MKSCNSVKVRRVMVKSVYCVTEYTIRSLLVAHISTVQYQYKLLSRIC